MKTLYTSKINKKEKRTIVHWNTPKNLSVSNILRFGKLDLDLLIWSKPEEKYPTHPKNFLPGIKTNQPNPINF